MLELKVADGLSRAAGTLRETATNPPGAQTARNTADRLDRAASYLREHRRPDLAACRDMIRRYPGAAISLALGLGFLSAAFAGAFRRQSRGNHRLKEA